METLHSVHFGDARNLEAFADACIELVVTSPPYPMIEMWDGILAAQSPAAAAALAREDGPAAFESMHRVLDAVWAEVARVLVPGGFACINIGDAVRTLDKRFQMYSNHARILSGCLRLGLENLPAIVWRKQTNAPNKYMGSGMLPAGAYVTLEHEFVLILRKAGKRDFKTPSEGERRRRSAFFWEERNAWFSDVWFDLKGVRQERKPGAARSRSGAFPLELALRLVCMYSVQGDRVLDPFLGTGTTLQASAITGRSGAGFEIDPGLAPEIAAGLEGLESLAAAAVQRRLEAHRDFVGARQAAKGSEAFGHVNAFYGFPVITRQEKELHLPVLESIRRITDTQWKADYAPVPVPIPGEPAPPPARRVTAPDPGPVQLCLPGLE